MQYTAFHQVRFYDTTLWCSIPEDVHAVSVQPNAFYSVQTLHSIRSDFIILLYGDLYLKMYMLFLCNLMPSTPCNTLHSIRSDFMILLYGVLYLKMYMLFLCNLMPSIPCNTLHSNQVRFYDTTLLCSIPEDVHAVSVQPNARAIHCIPSGQIL